RRNCCRPRRRSSASWTPSVSPRSGQGAAMRLHLLSDLHYESEAFVPVPAPQADALVLAGDIAADWRGFERFAGWPVPVLLVAGNHEFDRREWNDAWPALRAHVQGLGLRLLERESIELTGRDGRRVRLLGTTRWADF